jgi:hypothetical protein
MDKLFRSRQLYVTNVEQQGLVEVRTVFGDNVVLVLTLAAA